ncbi:NAD-dependent epimerase/dehydratase family protein, partial [Pelagibacteraceae bacterium]|nr:NAD-dependent epimerase/dehydratase family protein [Pelagibacteraceae bacterium]
MTNYLVTGATGYIGKRLVDYLVKNNNDSIVALSKSKKNIQSSTNLKIVNCDLAKSKVPDSCFDGIDVIIHLAGYAHDLSNSKNN